MNPKYLMSLLSTLGAKQDQRIIMKLVAPLVLGREWKLWLQWKSRRTNLRRTNMEQRENSKERNRTEAIVGKRCRETEE